MEKPGNFLFHFLTFLLLSAFSSLHAETAVTFIEDPVPPYVIGEMKQIPSSGIAVEIVRTVFNKLPGYEAKFLPLLPWKRSMELVKSGKVDALIYMIKTPEREEHFFFSNPTYSGKTVLFHHANRFSGNFEWNTSSELIPYTFCVMTGVAAAQYFERENESGIRFKFHTTQKPEDCINLMMLGRVDFFAENLTVGSHLLEKMNEKRNFTYAPKPLYETNFHIAFSKNSEAHRLIPKINSLLQKMRANGEITKLLESYR